MTTAPLGEVLVSDANARAQSHSLSHLVPLPFYLIPLNPTAAALAVALELAPQSFGDAQIATAPETIHLAAEVGSDLR